MNSTTSTSTPIYTNTLKEFKVPKKLYKVFIEDFFLNPTYREGGFDEYKIFIFSLDTLFNYIISLDLKRTTKLNYLNKFLEEPVLKELFLLTEIFDPNIRLTNFYRGLIIYINEYKERYTFKRSPNSIN